MDMNNNTLQNSAFSNVQAGGNLITRRKVTVTFSDFGNASTDEKVKLLLASLGDTIVDITGQLATPFKWDNGPATVLGSILKVTVGDMAALTGYNTSELCGSSVSTGMFFTTQTGFGGTNKGAYLWNASSGCRVNKVYTAAASIEAKFTASSFFTASLTSGAMHFFIDSIQNP